MELSNLKVGIALTGSFCTLTQVIDEIRNLKQKGLDIYPIVSPAVMNSDTRFGKSNDIITEIETITKKKVICSIVEAEPWSKRFFGCYGYLSVYR